MRMNPCHHVSKQMIGDCWTWLRLSSFIRVRMCMSRKITQSIHIEMNDLCKRNTISIKNGNTWIDIDYVSKPLRGFFKIVSFIVIME